jgi:hypothetical protein
MKKPLLPIVASKGIFSIDDVLPMVSLTYEGPEPILFRKTPVNFHNQRLKVFKLDGIQCRECGLEGQYFELVKLSTKPLWALHLYAEKDDKKILFTKDHIVPRSRGGSEELSNFQTLCYPCNRDKDDFHPEKDRSLRHREVGYHRQQEIDLTRIKKSIARTQRRIVEIKKRKAALDITTEEFVRLDLYHDNLKKRINTLKAMRKQLRGNPVLLRCQICGGFTH